MKKNSRVESITITEDGTLLVRIAKEILDDDGTVLSSAWHRTVVPPDTDPDDQMRVVNESLVRDRKCAPLEVEEINKVKSCATAMHTKEVKEAYINKQKREESKI